MSAAIAFMGQRAKVAMAPRKKFLGDFIGLKGLGC